MRGNWELAYGAWVVVSASSSCRKGVPRFSSRSFASLPEPMGELLTCLVSVFGPVEKFGFMIPEGSKDPNRRYVPETIITIPSTEALHTPYLGPLDP